ncbi:MAG: hypothetical protein A2033_03815 [Bacteroidetes bacterium GWA2_31_9]|nr:MAG: hypothetical protein A2033_03815 [Bacteroidetes bacterium GWA2_31_9]
MNFYFLIIFFAIAFISGILLNRFFLQKSKSYVIRKANTNSIRWSTQTKPVSGGITFYLIFIISIIFYFVINPNITISNEIAAIFLVTTLSFLMGLADDMINSSPYFKFFIQLLNSFILIKFGIYIHIFPNEIANYIITTLWVIGIMNSINMLDNMDAITSSVSFVIFSFILSLLISSFTFNYLFIIAFGIIASLAGFLIYNWSPAKMYMGDNGSQFLGALLSIFGIIFLWNHNLENQIISKNFILVALVFMMPLIDTTSVTINRLLKGNSPFVGGKDHTTHNLSYLGFNDRKVAITFIIMSLISCFFAFIIINEIIIWTSTFTIIFITYLSISFIVFYSITKLKHKK